MLECAGMRQTDWEIYMRQLDRIASDPAIFGGKPIIRGMRLSVELILSLLVQGETQEDLLDDLPGIAAQGHARLPGYAQAFLANEGHERGLWLG